MAWEHISAPAGRVLEQAAQSMEERNYRVVPVGELRSRIQAAVKTTGGVRAFARKHGYSATYVSQVCTGGIKPGAGLLSKIGIKRKIVYVEAAE